MRNRFIMSLLCVFTLGTGGSLYLFLRPDTYISKLIVGMLDLNVSASSQWVSVAFYLPDFLWCFSLGCGLFAIYPLKNGKSFLWGILVFLYGTLWETAQLFHWLPGTPDGIDILLYLMAGMTAVWINHLLNKGK